MKKITLFFVLSMLTVGFTAAFKTMNENPSLFVHHEIKGRNVFVECIVTGISFRELDDSKEKKGKMVIWIDGKKNQEVKSAAFIIKDLALGNHKLKLEVVNLHDQSYGLIEEFMVKISK